MFCYSSLRTHHLRPNHYKGEYNHRDVLFIVCSPTKCARSGISDPQQRGAYNFAKYFAKIH
jgi:hypothetical protein